MKKNLLFAGLAAFMVVSTVNAVPTHRNPSEIVPFSSKKIIPGGKITHNGVTFSIGKPEQTVSSRAASRAVPTTPLITNPEGSNKNYLKTSGGYSSMREYQDFDMVSSMVWDGDNVYFLDILSDVKVNTYIKGTKSGNVVKVPMNQTLISWDDEEYAVNIGLLKTQIYSFTSDDPEYEGQKMMGIYFQYSDDFAEAAYTLNPDGTLELTLPEIDNWVPPFGSSGDVAYYDPADYGFPYYALGSYYTDDLEWNGYCDIYQEFEEFNFEKVVMPENLTTQTFAYLKEIGDGKTVAVIVDAAVDNDKIYLKGLSYDAPEAVVMGNIIENGTKISFPQNQWVGTLNDVYYLLAQTGGLTNDGIGLIPDTEATFNIQRDPVTGDIVSMNSSSNRVFLIYNTAVTDYYPLDEFFGIVLDSKESFAGIPMTPDGIYYEDYSRWDFAGAKFIFFKLKPISVTGDILDASNLYYTISVNGELFEFYQHEGKNLAGDETILYPGMLEPTIFVPYSFNNGKDLFEDDGGTFCVALYVEDLQTVGVQAVYLYNGEYTYSEEVIYDVATGEISTGINEILNAEVVATEFYDLSGRRVTNPDKGIYIKRSLLSNGQTETMKIIVR